MKPYYEDLHVKLYNGDCRSMSELADNSIQCCVTSPPYWGLRKYAGNQDLIWGENHHEHEWVSETRAGLTGGTNCKAIGGWAGGSRGQDTVFKTVTTNTCSLCGAWRGAYGLEPTPELYVQHSIEILREIRRVLRKDGVCFWNIGDSYAGSWGNSGARDGGQRPQKVNRFERPAYDKHTERPASSYSQGTIKSKDLCLIPFRVAITAQMDGWWVRSVIIWSKNNPMPESVKDRPTESHEYILMLTKSAKYYWDMEAVREPYTEPLNRWGGPTLKRDTSKTAAYKDMQNIGNSSAMRVGRPIRPNEDGRNCRSVWEFSTHGYPEAHFATFPEELPERCLKAASKEGDVILDPFAGSGTTLWVAKKLNRKAVGYELSTEYCELAVKRNRQQVIL